LYQKWRPVCASTSTFADRRADQPSPTLQSGHATLSQRRARPHITRVERVVEDIARNIEAISDETVAKALLALADQIRTLRILNREDE
jgi:hypothetical protein